MSAEGRQSPIAHYINTPKWLSQITNHAERGTTFRAWMSLLSRKTQQKQQSGPSGDVPTVQVGLDAKIKDCSIGWGIRFVDGSDTWIDCEPALPDWDHAYIYFDT